MKNNNIIQLIIIICFFSCNGNKKDKKAEELVYNKQNMGAIIDSLPYNFKENDFSETIIAYKKIKKDIKNKYKAPPYGLLKNKIEEIFKLDVDKVNYRIIFLDDDSMFPKELLYYEKFILPDTYTFREFSDGNLENIDYDAFLKTILHYNNMIFYNDISATNWIKTKEPARIINLVKEQGYIKNKDWLQFAFSKSKLYKPDELERFLFDSKCRGEERTENGDCTGMLHTLRKDMLDKMIEYGAELSQLSTVANMVSNGNQEAYEENKEELYAYLMAHCYKAGQSGIIEYLYDSNPKIIEVFRKKDFYGIEDLKDFTDNFYKPQNKRFGLSSLGPDPYISYGVINDPDGYTNLRHGKESSSKVIKRVKTGEKFGIETNKGAWWIVVTEDGSRGFMHRSRITIIKE
ncbi:SH3 domain-containing protein [Tenacibaculum finnmarkense]|uniref:SH3 domain-containing protein n=1 Tax=Tenacibaculum finnmarkense TaxID=2781243 RepID=UPI001EFA9774|nr:SH3 domain-containing protein [Tenacibaculum finnmarkense]MCG8865320.1 SH3 domain-containing protein [Tenacibaculum finnmarkense]